MELRSSFLPPYVPTRPMVRGLTILLLITAALSCVSAGVEIAEIRVLIGMRNSWSLDEATRWAARALEDHFGAGVIEGGIRAFVITAS